MQLIIIHVTDWGWLSLYCDVCRYWRARNGAGVFWSSRGKQLPSGVWLCRRDTHSSAGASDRCWQLLQQQRVPLHRPASCMQCQPGIHRQLCWVVRSGKRRQGVAAQLSRQSVAAQCRRDTSQHPSAGRLHLPTGHLSDDTVPEQWTTVQQTESVQHEAELKASHRGMQDSVVILGPTTWVCVSCQRHWQFQIEDTVKLCCLVWEISQLRVPCTHSIKRHAMKWRSTSLTSASSMNVTIM